MLTRVVGKGGLFAPANGWSEIVSWNKGLSGSALAIAATNQSPLRVVAGPGTGKSFAMKRRVARLLQQGQNPERIMAVTFTRNAAASLVQDLRDLNIPGCDEVHVGTLHSYCFSLLNRDRIFAYLRRVPRPIITFEKSKSLQYEGAAMLHDISRGGGFGGRRDCTKRVKAFEAAWARLQSEMPGWPDDQVDKRFETELLDWLRFHEAILIGELVPEALRYLRNNPMSQALSEFDHVIVDEYQDLNRAEQEIVDLLSQGGAAAIVGDSDQSIYRFRHANPDGIDDFPRRHPSTHDESLVECRRCPTRVVGLANHLIMNNHPPGSQPRLQPMSGNTQGEIHVTQWNNSDSEAAGIVRYIAHLLANRPYVPGDILVLTPRRRLAYQIRDLLDGQDIAAHSFYPEEALEDRGAQRALSLLTLLSNRADRVALRWWLGHKSSSALRGSYGKLRTHCETVGSPPWQELEKLDQGCLHLAGDSHLVPVFRELKKELGHLGQLSVSELVDFLLPVDDDGLAPLRDIALASPSESAEELFEYIRSHVTHPEIPEGDFVRIMSLQKSKGLTSKIVIVTGCIEGLVPFVEDDASLQEQDSILREQRRLFYVAVTRCTDVLVLSSFMNIDLGLAKNIGAQVQGRRWPLGRTIASRFFSELGPSAPLPRAGASWAASGYSDPAIKP